MLSYSSTHWPNGRPNNAAMRHSFCADQPPWNAVADSSPRAVENCRLPFGGQCPETVQRTQVTGLLMDHCCALVLQPELPEQPASAVVAEEASRSPEPAPRSSRQHDHPNLHQDSSSPLLQVNFWLTLLISALAAALLS
ncbi:unnamed protein product [Ixodes pacificus]